MAKRLLRQFVRAPRSFTASACASTAPGGLHDGQKTLSQSFSQQRLETTRRLEQVYEGKKQHGYSNLPGHDILTASAHPKGSHPCSEWDKKAELKLLTQHVYAVGEEEMYTSLSSCHHTWFSDEIQAFGGEDRAPNALVYFLSSLAASEVETARYVALHNMKPKLDLGKLFLHVNGIINPDGFRGVPSVSSTWEKINMEVLITSEEMVSDDRLNELRGKTATQSPIHALCKAANIQMHVEYKELMHTATS